MLPDCPKEQSKTKEFSPFVNGIENLRFRHNGEPENSLILKKYFILKKGE